ncbi:uncharacterized protein E0L32_002750 [Thyridium curvatum]|uniref:Uncharacterized protein n=1 Tax=Thyridium curvatum TaxID=1093900 RepID=A0A507BM36_9PEZI|nr:uncharacterized protein E0L32_002750 [Thyridium curvatum]TPX18241.1 hypothetical protein E0L32_002750 [Thyridium curvatum]
MNIQSSTFTEHVVNAMRSLYPEELADRAWDNVGLLLENSEQASEATPTVLLTNDLTPEVAEEAIAKGASVIVTYRKPEEATHPFIFRGLKSVTLRDPQQKILIRLAQANVAVYSPHTAMDAALGGINDWLADMVVRPADGSAPAAREAERRVVQPVAQPPPGFEGTGYGRLVRFESAVPFGAVVRAVARGVGGMRRVMVAAPRRRRDGGGGGGAKASADEVSSAAVCAGSGWDVLKDCDADVFVTGETSHHSALRAVMLGKRVVMVFHSNSERLFLRQRLQGQLRDHLRGQGVECSVLVSEADADPFEIWDVDDMP